jgi:hypothetical protein
MVFLLGQMRKEKKDERKGDEIDPRREFFFRGVVSKRILLL